MDVVTGFVGPFAAPLRAAETGAEVFRAGLPVDFAAVRTFEGAAALVAVAPFPGLAVTVAARALAARPPPVEAAFVTRAADAGLAFLDTAALAPPARPALAAAGFALALVDLDTECPLLAAAVRLVPDLADAAAVFDLAGLAAAFRAGLAVALAETALPVPLLPAGLLPVGRFPVADLVADPLLAEVFLAPVFAADVFAVTGLRADAFEAARVALTLSALVLGDMSDTLPS